MNVEVLRELMVRRPFEPFRIRLSSGDVYEVRHPEMALLFKAGIYVAIPIANGDIPDKAVECALLHIAAVEAAPAAA